LRLAGAIISDRRNQLQLFIILFSGDFRFVEQLTAGR
jgi:hypothetical protein